MWQDFAVYTSFVAILYRSISGGLENIAMVFGHFFKYSGYMVQRVECD